MNEDASRGVSAELSIGAELDSILWIGIGLLAAGASSPQAPRSQSRRPRAADADPSRRLAGLRPWASGRALLA